MAIRDAIIAVDFDGTVVTHAYPHIGNDIGAVPVLRELIGNGCRVILYTMRSGRLLDDAVAWFARNDIPLYAVNENPAQREWTDSRQLGQGAAASRRRGLSRLSRPACGKPAGYPSHLLRGRS